MQKEKVWIDKTGRRNNPHRTIVVDGVTFTDGQILEPAFKPYFDVIGFREIEVEVQPDDYTPEIYRRDEVNDDPYIVYERKPQSEIERNEDDKARMQAQYYLDSTDYLFTVDRHMALLTQEPDREKEIYGKREEARAVIRAFKAKYPEPV